MEWSGQARGDGQRKILEGGKEEAGGDRRKEEGKEVREGGVGRSRKVRGEVTEVVRLTSWIAPITTCCTSCCIDMIAWM